MFTQRNYYLLTQSLKCLVYLGLAHTGFEAMSIYRTPDVSHLWYFALVSPGMYYLILSIVLTIAVWLFEKKLKK